MRWDERPAGALSCQLLLWVTVAELCWGNSGSLRRTCSTSAPPKGSLFTKSHQRRSEGHSWGALEQPPLILDTDSNIFLNTR